MMTSPEILPWTMRRPLDPVSMRRLRRAMALEGCKWDPQVEDTAALHPSVLELRPGVWERLAALAEALDREALAAESELRTRPDLIRRLSLPRKIERVLIGSRSQPHGPRVSRYDFHWTDDGWRISEVNSDVPGGYVEASDFTRRMALATDLGPSAIPDPVEALLNTIARSITASGPIALVHATAYSDDAQVMHLLARAMEARGLDPLLCSPEGITWPNRRRPGPGSLSIPAMILRFFPAEWLPNLPRSSEWARYFVDNSIPQTNPATAILTQSKRWGLCWDDLSVPLPTWRALCPRNRAVGTALGRIDDQLVYKPALGRVGDGVLMGTAPAGPGERDRRQSLRALRSDRFWTTLGCRSHWIAQDRFWPRGIPDGAGGERTVCLGVYVIDGQGAGVYGRVATTGWVQHAAQDLAVHAPCPSETLVRPDAGGVPELATMGRS